MVVLDDWDRVCSGSAELRALSRDYDVRVYSDWASDDELRGRLSRAEVVVLFRERTRLDAEMLKTAPSLRLIAQTGRGTAHIDMEAAAKLGIAVRTTPSASAASVVEHTLALLLSVYHRIGEGDRAMHDGEWLHLPGRELNGKTLGILGVGKIGMGVASISAALGLHVLGWPPRSPDDRRPDPDGIEWASSLDDLLERADCLSIHLRLTERTRKLIGRRELQRMRWGAVLVNTARGDIVHEDALVEALMSGSLSGAGLDVFSHEPLAADSPLRQLPNVVLTPHAAWTTIEAQSRFADVAARAVREFFEESVSVRSDAPR